MSEVSLPQKQKKKSVFDKIAKRGHEQVVYCYDEATGLKAIIALHNTVLGPGMGGTRMWEYASDQSALTDALRLSRGMTFKNSLAGLNIGGGKAVIIGDVKKLKNEALMRRFGRFVDGLAGRYITAEDVNMTSRDMEHISMETKNVVGLPESMGGSGDPSPVTAYGTYIGMKASAKKAYGSDSLKGKKISVQGVGHVGSYLVGHLVKEGAEVFVSDISEEKLKIVAKEHGVTIVDKNEVYNLDVDIYAPCALGATLNDETIPKLKCAIVAGAANNQLEDEKLHAQALIDRGIIYAPDFLINAGGIINVYMEYLGNYNRDAAYNQTEKIYDTCLSIFDKSENEGISTQAAAMKLALKRIEDIGKVKLSY